MKNKPSVGHHVSSILLGSSHQATLSFLFIVRKFFLSFLFSRRYLVLLFILFFFVSVVTRISLVIFHPLLDLGFVWYTYSMCISVFFRFYYLAQLSVLWIRIVLMPIRIRLSIFRAVRIWIGIEQCRSTCGSYPKCYTSWKIGQTFYFYSQ